MILMFLFHNILFCCCFTLICFDSIYVFTFMFILIFNFIVILYFHFYFHVYFNVHFCSPSRFIRIAMFTFILFLCLLSFYFYYRMFH